MKPSILDKLAQLRPHLTVKLALSVGISLAIAAISQQIHLPRVEAFFYDSQMKLKGNESVSKDIALLALGEKNELDPTGSEWTSIESHLKVLQQLLQQRPKAILYFNKFDPAEIESKPAISEQFVALAKAAADQGTQVILGTDLDLSGEVMPPYPLNGLQHAPAILHKDGTVFSEDKVMRRAVLNVNDQPTIHMRAAFPGLNSHDLFEKAKSLRGAYFYKPAESWHLLTRYFSDTSLSDNKYPTVYFWDAMNGINLQKFNNKIVLVETMRKDAMNDFAYTPYSRVTYDNPKLIIHAAILDTILNNRGITEAPKYLDIFLTFALSLVLAFAAINMSPSKVIVTLAILAISLLTSSLLSFKLGLWINLVHPLLSMFFTYYLIVPYRLILEYRKRWEVQEKHDLLIQVEEMKGNFLSLMSHDLKTPVARIQGLSEMLLRSPNLTKDQSDEIKQIISSTENLDKFISKILNLTKVESNEIKLDKRSRDVNKILEQCLAKLEFQAKKKNITLEADLDALFPIHVDVTLLIQVFTNIIDNAIKYSPPNSKVKVTSREIGDMINICIEDNGPGLDAKQKEQLFTKFFRGNPELGEENKGSGLGLYLSKYFIELHKGTIKAESEAGIGSKFIVNLPIDNSGA